MRAADMNDVETAIGGGAEAVVHRVDVAPPCPRRFRKCAGKGLLDRTERRRHARQDEQRDAARSRHAGAERVELVEARPPVEAAQYRHAVASDAADMKTEAAEIAA